MEQLAGAAQVAAQAAAALPTKRKRRTQFEIARADVDEAVAKLAKIESALTAAQVALAAAKTVASRASREALVATAKAKQSAQVQVIENARSKFKLAQQAEAEKAAVVAAKAVSAVAEEEVNRNMSEQGMQMLVRLRLAAQSKIDNKTDKNDKVWEVDIEAKFTWDPNSGSVPTRMTVQNFLVCWGCVMVG